MDMFNNEFRVRLSLIMSPLPSSICFSKARIESMLVSRPILALGQNREVPQNARTYIDTNTFSWFSGTDGSRGCPEEEEGVDDGESPYESFGRFATTSVSGKCQDRQVLPVP